MKWTIELEEPYEDEEPIKLFRKNSNKGTNDENKENEVPDDDTSLKEELLKDEQEIMEIYEDLDRHLKLIEDEKKVESVSVCESLDKRAESEVIPIDEPPKPPEIPVFKPVNVIKILNEPPLPLPELIFTLDGVDDESGHNGSSGGSKEGTAEDDGDYAKISVKDLIHTFENVQHNQKVHVREIDRMVKEPSSETEVSEGKRTRTLLDVEINVPFICDSLFLCVKCVTRHLLLHNFCVTIFLKIELSNFELSLKRDISRYSRNHFLSFVKLMTLLVDFSFESSSFDGR